MYIKLKSDVGNILKGSVVEVLEGDGYFYIKEGKERYTVNPNAHDEVLPKYVHRTSESSNYHLSKNYSVNGQRYRIVIPGFKTVEEAKNQVHVIESIGRTVDKIAQQARDLYEENKKLKQEIEKNDELPKVKNLIGEIEKLMTENARLKYEMEVERNTIKLNAILGGKQ